MVLAVAGCDIAEYDNSRATQATAAALTAARKRARAFVRSAALNKKHFLCSLCSKWMYGRDGRANGVVFTQVHGTERRTGWLVLQCVCCCAAAARAVLQPSVGNYQTDWGWDEDERYASGKTRSVNVKRIFERVFS